MVKCWGHAVARRRGDERVAIDRLHSCDGIEVGGRE